MTFRRAAITAAILSVYAVPHLARAQTNDAEQPETPRTESAILQFMPIAVDGNQPIADRPVIRGFNSTSNLFVDGVRDIGDQSRDVFDLEAVEVVKGADSVHAGRGSGGGSINLVSKTAKFADFTQGSFTVGTADKFRATVDQNRKLGEATGFRIGVLAESSGVPGHNDAVDYDKYGVSPSLAFGIGEATRVTPDYYHLTDKGTPD